MTQLPVAYISTLYTQPPKRSRDGLAGETLGELIEHLADAEVRSPALSSLIRGKLYGADLHRAALLVLGDDTIEAIAEWAGYLAMSSYTSIVGCASSDIGRPGHLGPSDMPLLTGHGIALASRGSSGRPLVGLSLEDLRQELEESRQRLSRLAGYQIRTLLPSPSTLGNAVDGLILEEARRAGYRIVLQPGRAVTQLDHASHGLQTLQYRTIRSDETSSQLLDWIVGKGLARPLAQVREIVNRPRRILSRFGID